MRWWERQIGGPMRGRIIALLRRGSSTVEELAAALGVTDNAVRAHLQLIERENQRFGYEHAAILSEMAARVRQVIHPHCALLR